MIVKNIGVQPLYIGNVLLYGGHQKEIDDKIMEKYKGTVAGEYYTKHHLTLTPCKKKKEVKKASADKGKVAGE